MSGIYILKDGVPWILATQGAISSEINKGCIQVHGSLQTRVELLLFIYFFFLIIPNVIRK